MSAGEETKSSVLGHQQRQELEVLDGLTVLYRMHWHLLVALFRSVIGALGSILGSPGSHAGLPSLIHSDLPALCRIGGFHGGGPRPNNYHTMHTHAESCEIPIVARHFVVRRGAAINNLPCLPDSRSCNFAA